MAGRRAPSFSGLDGWQQSAPRSITQFRGRVVVVWFFSRSQPACLSMVPGLKAMDREFGGDLQIIGIHSPDYARDADPLALARTAATSGMTWPVGMDHRRTVFSRWQADQSTQGWPRTYVVDRAGRVVLDHTGPDLGPVRAAVSRLLSAQTTG